MAYKKYIKRGGKVYGPYIYHSRREAGKVVSEYHGAHKKTYKPNYKRISVAIAGIIAIIAIVYMGFNIDKVFTGRSIMDIDAEYSDGIVSGQLLLSNQEEITTASRIIFENNGNQILETHLDQFLQTEVFFDMIILTGGQETPPSGTTGSENNEQTPETNEEETEIPPTNTTEENPANETEPSEETTPPISNSTENEENQEEPTNTNETPSENEGATNEEETNTETPEGETPPQENTEETTNEENQEQEASEGGPAPITGGAISGGIKIVEGSVMIGESFKYKLKEGEQFSEIDSGSIKTDSNSLGLEVLKVKVKKKSVVVTTNYIRDQIVIDLESLNLTLEEGILNIKVINELEVETSSIKVNVSTMEVIESSEPEESSNETVPYLNEIGELTPEERKALEAKFGNSPIETKKAVIKNGFLIIEYQLGSYNSEFSYNPELNDETLTTFMNRDRDKWVKDIAKSILRSKPMETQVTGLNQPYNF